MTASVDANRLGRGSPAGFRRRNAFHCEHSPSAARCIGERILKAVALLETFPEIAPPSRHRGLRQLVVTRTPYLVVYRIHEANVEIRAVVHAKQKRRK